MNTLACHLAPHSLGCTKPYTLYQHVLSAHLVEVLGLGFVAAETQGERAETVETHDIALGKTVGNDA